MKKSDTVVIGSRGSELAIWQSRWVLNEIAKCNPHVECTINIIKTTGDKILDSPLSKIGDKGLFTREIERALLDGSIDLAVHSLKDLPTELPEGLMIGAICKREDVRDVFLPHPANPRRKLLEQPNGAQIATGSLRRKCQLLNLRPDFEVVDVRGNLNTRMKKLAESDWAGMVLARAGVVRLGWEDRIGETVDPETIMPAVGQGALGIEIRSGDEPIQTLVALLSDTRTAQATMAERALLRRLEGGCQVPIGTYGRVEFSFGKMPVLKLDAFVGSLDGRTIVRGKIEGSPTQGEELGARLAEVLLHGGADKVLRQIRELSPKRGFEYIET